MTILTAPAVSVKPVRSPRKTYPAPRCDVRILQPVIFPCTLHPAGYPGIVLLNNEVYCLSAITSEADCEDGFILEGFRFVKATNPDEPRDVECTRWGLECSCPDRAYRVRQGGTCKHEKACCILKERGQLI